MLAVKSEEDSPRSKRTIKRPQHRFLDDIVQADQVTPKRKRRRPRAPRLDIQNDPEKWKLTDSQRLMLENESRHIDLNEYDPRVYNHILRQRATEHAVENELAHGRRRDGIHLLMATNAVAEMQNRRLSSLDRQDFLEEMYQLKGRINTMLREEWMFRGQRAAKEDIEEDDRYTLEQANAVDEEGGDDDDDNDNEDSAYPITGGSTAMRDNDVDQGDFGKGGGSAGKLRLALKKNESDTIADERASTPAEAPEELIQGDGEKNFRRPVKLRLKLKKEFD